jgi:hypothetical protein
MINQQLIVSNNGKDIAITCLGNDAYFLQISYKPLKIQRRMDGEGSEKWIDIESNLETPLAKEMGRLITHQLLVSS